MRRLPADDVEGRSEAGRGGRDEGGCGERPEIRRRLRGGGLSSGAGIVLFTPIDKHLRKVAIDFRKGPSTVP